MLNYSAKSEQIIKSTESILSRQTNHLKPIYRFEIQVSKVGQSDS